MAETETFETCGGIAVIEVPGGDAGKARLVWGDALFHAEFPGARGGAASGLGDDEVSRGKFARALSALAPGGTATVACEGDWLFGRDFLGLLRAVRLGPSSFLLSFPFADGIAAEALTAGVAEALDGLPMALAICAAEGGGEILWVNEAFRQLMSGTDFDLMGAALSDQLAIPGTYTMLLASTGPLAPSAPFPTALKTLEGMMTPVMISAKRMPFRGRTAAMVCLARAV